MAKRQLPSAQRAIEIAAVSKPTLRTIAELAGLGVSTVSRALANAPQISQDTRDLVRKIADEVGYLPDRAALRLRTGRTNVVSLLMDSHEEILGFGTSIMLGLTNALQGTAYHLIVMPNFIKSSNVEAVEYIVRNNLADGLIFTRTELLEHLWDANYEGTSNIVDQYIAYLRRKIDKPFGRADLETVRGAGYRLTTTHG